MISDAMPRGRSDERVPRRMVSVLGSPPHAGPARSGACAMFRNARHLENFELCARDGNIGFVEDFLFDDQQWIVRYFVVDTGTWLEGREVLISPAAVHPPRWHERVLPVDLTRAQVRNSPGVDAEEPVSREQELQLAQYYSWPIYWGAAGFGEPLIFVTPPVAPHPAVRAAEPAPVAADAPHHLRSVDDVRGYHLEATDGEIGHVDDFILDDENWRIEYLVVDTRNWWPGKRVLMPPGCIYHIGWNEAKVAVDLSREAIRRSPKYDPNEPVTAAYAEQRENAKCETRNAEAKSGTAENWENGKPEQEPK